MDDSPIKEVEQQIHATQATQVKNPIELSSTPSKGRRMVRKNMSMNSVRVDITREKIDLMFGEVELGKVEL